MAAIQEQAAATRDIARKVECIAESAERNSPAVSQQASMAKQLENQAQELGRLASHFRV